MREDIQCLRGIAILLVILFHMTPATFPNGFLGVDIFFVISGFLMAKKLTLMNLWEISNVGKFYYMRFRRILPMYYLVIFFTNITVHWILGDIFWDTNHRYSLASLFMVTNQLVIHDQSDYFNAFVATTFSRNAFVHLWSLSLEMQFYLFVPLIFLGLQTLRNDYLKIGAVSVMAFGTFIGFILAEKSFSFNFMFLRLWQFSAGFLAMFWSKTDRGKRETEESLEKSWRFMSREDIVIACLCILGLAGLPGKIEVMYLRPTVTIATAVIITTQAEGVKILQSAGLGFVGDISYVLYLVHWPVIMLFHFGTIHSYMFCILTMFILSIIANNLFEKPYLRFGVKSTVVLVFLIIAANAYVQYSVHTNPSAWNSHLDPEVREITDRNLAAHKEIWEKHNAGDAQCVPGQPVPNELVLRFCHYQGHGRSSIMMLGNSFVVNFGENIRAHFQNNYREWRYFSAIHGYGLYFDGSPKSQSQLEFSRQQVEMHKPDVLIIVSRFDKEMRKPVQANDTFIQQINENLAVYQRFVKTIYILDAFPKYPDGFLNRFLLDVLTRPEHLPYVHMNKRQVEKEMKHVKTRLAQIDCTKCHFFDLSRVFLKDDKYLSFDEQTTTAYFDNSNHLTVPAVQLCEPVFEKLAQQVMNDF